MIVQYLAETFKAMNFDHKNMKEQKGEKLQSHPEQISLHKKKLEQGQSTELQIRASSQLGIKKPQTLNQHREIATPQMNKDVWHTIRTGERLQLDEFYLEGVGECNTPAMVGLNRAPQKLQQ